MAAPSMSPDTARDAAATGLTRRPRRLRKPMVIVAAAYLVLLVGVSLFAEWVSPYDPLEQNYDAILQGPSGAHWLGTDDLGRDVLSRLIHGARVTVFAGLLAISVGAFIGIPLGLIAGLTRRTWLDSALMRVIDTLMSFPALVIALGIVGALGPGLVNAMFAIGLTFVPVLARLMRATTLSVRGSLYVEASMVLGSRSAHLVRRHILPNAIQPVIVQITLLLAVALLAEAALSFLGLGVQPPDPSWGAMLGRAYRFLGVAPLQVLPPGLAIVSVVLAINTLGEALRVHLDPRSGEK